MNKYKGHTPEPWFVHDFRKIGGELAVSCTDPDHVTVAYIGQGITNTEEEVMSNAQLITDAPKLLTERYLLRKSLESCVNEIEVLCRKYGIVLFIDEKRNDFLSVARDLLQKTRDEE